MSLYAVVLLAAGVISHCSGLSAVLKLYNGCKDGVFLTPVAVNTF